MSSINKKHKEGSPFLIANILFFMIFSFFVIVYFGTHSFGETLDWLARYWGYALVLYAFAVVTFSASSK